MNGLRCNCCGRVITPATLSPAHTYRLPVYELVAWHGQRAALRIGWRRAAVCAVCVARIQAATERRREGRISEKWPTI